jgi:hypothetical protein
MNPILIFGFVVLALAALLVIGLRLRPRPFPAIPQTAPAQTVSLPADLPTPVRRFLQKFYGGDQTPHIETAVISGRGVMRLAGIALPLRFRFTHLAGKDYRHYIETTLFGIPIMKVNEYYVNGKARMELPWGVTADNPKLDQGAVIGMWAEIVLWIPAVLVTDSRVRWQPVDEDTAFLCVPFGDSEERFLLRFGADGGMKYLESMRYKGGEGEKVLWINGAWFDDYLRWADFNAEELAVNVPVQVSMDKKGV